MRKLTLGLLCGLLTQQAAQADHLDELELPAGAPSLAPRLAADGDGQAILSWLEGDGDAHRLLYATFDGDRFGPAREIARNPDFFVNWADTPGLIVLPNGTWLAHWLQRSGQGAYAYDVFASISTDGVAGWSPPFSPHADGTLTEHGFVSTFVAGDAFVGMAWLDGRDTRPDPLDASSGHHGHAGAMTLRTAVVGSDGRVQRPSRLDARVCDCCGTDAALTDEGAVVVYRDRDESEIRDISLVRQSPDGWSDPVTVHHDGWRIEGCPVNGPAVLARGRKVVVAWFTLAGGVPKIHLALSDNGGREFAAPLALDAGQALGRVDLAWTRDGFALSWMAQPGGAGVMRLARFSPDGKLLNRHDVTPLDGGRGSGFPRLLSLVDGRLMLTWTQRDAESGQPRVRAGLLPNGD